MNFKICLMTVVVALSGILTVSPRAMADGNADYFARFKYDNSQVMSLLANASGRPIADSPQAKEYLDDMGYWSIVRAPGPFIFTPELQNQIAAQLKYLKKAYTYEPSDIVWLKAESEDEKPYGIAKVNHRAVIREHQLVDGTDYYLVEEYVDGASQMSRRQGVLYNDKPGEILYYKDDYKLNSKMKVVTKTELDEMNSPASSLEKDNVGEVLDWKNDKIWQNKLEDFKAKMVSENFAVDWTAKPTELYAKQSELLLRIFSFFKMNRNAPKNNGQGIGMRACGGGVCFDQALVLSFAIQALGQTQGLKAMNLNGTTLNPEGGHGFVRVDIKTKTVKTIFERVINFDEWLTNRNLVLSSELYAHEDPMAVLMSKATNIVYKGQAVEASNSVLIADPGWFDYGITPDQFARLNVTMALNPLPIDSNRAVHGLSSHKTLAEVSAAVGAKGPLNVASAQQVKTLSPTDRAATQSRLFSQPRTCQILFAPITWHF